MADRTLVHRAAYEISVPLRAVQVDPHLRFLCSPIWHFCLLKGRQSAVLRLQNSQCGGLVLQDSGGGRLETQARVRLGPRARQSRSVEAEARSQASELRASVRHLLRLECVSMRAA